MTFPAVHQATVHSPPSARHLSAVVWVELRCIAEKIFDNQHQISQEHNKNYYRNPLVSDDFINGKSLLGICFETSLDELLGVLGYVCPLRLWELVLP